MLYCTKCQCIFPDMCEDCVEVVKMDFEKETIQDEIEYNNFVNSLPEYEMIDD